MIQAGIFDPRAVGYFFLARTALAVGIATARRFCSRRCSKTVRCSGVAGFGGIIGYLGPSLYIDNASRRAKPSIRPAFRISWICWWSAPTPGSAWRRRSTASAASLSDSYPSLTANIHMTNLEIRAGRTMSDALEHLGDRLGIEEARSFATLIQQSAELGSSITEALRVYSDDMRHKRLSRAEEKAYSLPAKLSVPMMVCIFPVLFVVILLPVFVRLHVGNY